MDIGGLNLFGQLKGKMQWHNARQTVLAQNVANADTPNYKGRDLHMYDPNSTFNRQLAMQPVVTSENHMKLVGSFVSENQSKKTTGYETTPYRNSVTLEQEMLKVTENQMDYQVASTVYQKNLGILKLAVRR